MTMDHAPPKKCSLKIYIRLTGAQFWQNDLRFSNRLSFQASRSTGWFALEPVPLRPLPPIIRELDHLGAAPTGIWRGFQFSRFSHGQRMASTCWMVFFAASRTPRASTLTPMKKEKKVVIVARLDLLILHQPTGCRKKFTLRRCEQY